MNRRSWQPSLRHILIAGALMASLTGPACEAGERAHTDETFSFVANGRVDEVFPLFGALTERVWAPDWDPTFRWPSPGTDQEGMVFEVAHGQGRSTWVNTTFDREHGRVQYVYVLPDVVATRITLDLQPEGESTNVRVRYERTALTSASDARVEAMAARDRVAGPEWSGQINGYLDSRHRP